jgi:serine/threonine protein kinase
MRSHGYYRTVYLSSATNTEPIVIKMLNWRFNFSYDDFEYMRMDALVNERLNGNPEIVLSYAFCGNSIVGEAMAFGDLHEVAVPSGIGRVLPSLENETNLIVRNTLSGTQKLELSLQMAESVLLLHAFPDGVIVHDDIQLSQFLLSKTEKLKLNDFNRAEIMLWNEKDQEYCKYRNSPGWGDVSSYHVHTTLLHATVVNLI